jgi:hypothetical protein
MAQAEKYNLNLYERIDRVENVLITILEMMKLPKLETFHEKSIQKTKTLPTRQLVEPICTEIKPYEYDKLDPNARQIRLFELAPMKGIVHDDETINGTLKTYSLDLLMDPMRNDIKSIDLAGLPLKTDPKYWQEYSHRMTNRRTRYGYNALSYTWGEPIMNTKIFIDGRSYLVTKNLKSALSRMSRKKNARTNLWWIDQICSIILHA